MTITTLAVGAAVTPTVVKTYISHYANRKERREKPTAHISYDQGLHLIRTFLKYASHHTVEDLQSFTGQWVPSPSWVRTENVTVPDDYLAKAARTITSQLGPVGVESVGGTKWWQWRPRGGELKAEWIEMRAHYNEQKRQGSKSRRVMLYVHGGAYFFGSVDEHRYQMQRHARKLKARVFAPRYRLAPQFPFPSGLQDCLAAYLYLLDMHDSTEIILAGDSAGGGMIVSILCMLRDQALPLPAGAILISPWVDLSHSFPSLSGNAELDYIPAYGFMQKPSAAWPPPNDEEIATISRLARGDEGSPKVAQDRDKTTNVPVQDDGGVKPGPQLPLSIELNGRQVVLKDQIQMYTTNQLLAHPLVSPVLQPSLGGLPPVLILTGGGEILRDEQIYLAHKMANPSKYPLGAAYRSRYDPDDKILNKYKPTPVMLQVWDDLCHVAPTLSFTRPAKFMYRSVAQFGAWVLAKAQKRAIEIMDDDNISRISSQSDSGSASDAEAASPADSISRAKIDASKTTGSVGRAGDPIPPFTNNMIRQRIDRYGRIYPLAEPHDLPALQMQPDDVGVIKPGPVRKWLEAKASWDARYASTRKRVQKERVKALASGKIMGFEAGEHPPPSALAGRRTDKDIVAVKKRKSYGLAMWSGWGSKHDETTLKREEEAVEDGQPVSERDGDTEIPLGTDGQVETSPAEVTAVKRAQSRNRSSSTKRTTSESRTRGRKRTISVTDRGQTEGRFVPAIVPPQHSMSSAESPEAGTIPTVPHDERATSPTASLLSSGFLPKFKTASHLRDDSGSSPHYAPILSDAASTMTGRSGMVPDDASTRAVFAATGVMKNGDAQQEVGEPAKTSNTSSTTTRRPQSALAHETTSVNSDGGEELEVDDGVASMAPSAMSRPHTSLAGFGSDSPRSQRSLDRLQSHQLDEGMGRMAPLRSTSSTAVVRAEGVVSVIDGTYDKIKHQVADGTYDMTGHQVADGTLDRAGHQTADQEEKKNDVATEKSVEATDNVKEDEEELIQNVVDHSEKSGTKRPKMYDRTETDFQTAFEKMS
ncbi:esterase/lipase [Cladophialophora yegresii CBS 114405]|uniref:Esterase/lipase n=1 Tax=Cladophialophora yegresii CBS 114405 TaxID=1182544 RepID=W9VE90_9EURO|nr:esterase/lipase [Cladophialophora yegresii CBS 114405]EXJ53922.1 esterase/lipase [Cladophialophora yegresii CBS 114405]